MPKLNHDAKIGFVFNDFANLRDDELSLLIKLKYDKYMINKLSIVNMEKYVFCATSQKWTINIQFVIQEAALSS